MSNEINTTFNKIDLDGFNNIVKELQNNKQYIITALNEKGVAASINDTFMELANKITQIKEKEIITLPAETSNDFANTFFNTMMKSQGYDKMYETVWANYCGENGYVGALMTSLNKGTNTSIVLTGADAYYIYEEDKFYTVDENKKLVTVINGISTNLGTQSHLWDVENKNIIRTVFYLYKEDSTADGSRENVHPSAFDYCRDSNIPNIQYKSNSGNVMHFHVSNPDTCNLKWNGGSTANTRCYYFYTNVENANAQWMLPSNNHILTFVDFSTLKKLTSGTLLQASRVKKLDFPNLTEVSGGTLISQCNALESVDLSNLQSVSDGTLIDNCASIKHITLPIFKGLDDESLKSVVLIKNLKLKTLLLPSVKTISTTVNISISASTIENGLDLTSLNNKQGAGNMISAQALLMGTICPIIYFPDSIETGMISSWMGHTGIYNENLTIYVKNHITSFRNFGVVNNVKKLYFPTIESCYLWIGGNGAYYNSALDYVFLKCNGKRNQEIRLDSTQNTLTDKYRDIEIGEGARQIISINLYMTAENIVNHIFKKLADNNYEDDGITPAPAIKITIGSANLNRLTDEEKAIATDKNYILA